MFLVIRWTLTKHTRARNSENRTFRLDQPSAPLSQARQGPDQMQFPLSWPRSLGPKNSSSLISIVCVHIHRSTAPILLHKRKRNQNKQVPFFFCQAMVKRASKFIGSIDPWRPTGAHPSERGLCDFSRFLLLATVTHKLMAGENVSGVLFQSRFAPRGGCGATHVIGHRCRGETIEHGSTFTNNNQKPNKSRHQPRRF